MTKLLKQTLIYCTRKITRLKYNKTRSFKNYATDLYSKELDKIKFPDYLKFTDINSAFSDFIQRLAFVIDRIPTIKEIHIKNNSQDWLDEEIHEQIELRDKLFATFNNSKKQCDDVNYRKVRNRV